MDPPFDVSWCLALSLLIFSIVRYQSDDLNQSDSACICFVLTLSFLPDVGGISCVRNCDGTQIMEHKPSVCL